MDSLPGEIEDSRTSEVGRKRDLDQFTLPDQPMSDGSDNSPERSHKRARPDFDTGHIGSIANTFLLNTSSLFQPVKPTTGGPQIAPADQPTTVVAQPMTWNRGVQSGLRTSFGSKAPSLTASTASTPVQDVGEVNASMSSLETHPKENASQPALDSGPGANIHDIVEIVETKPPAQRKTGVNLHDVVETKLPTQRKTGENLDNVVETKQPVQPKTGRNLHDVVEAKPPVQPKTADTEGTIPKGKNAKKKKPQASGPDTGGVKATKEVRLTRSVAAQNEKESQFPRPLQPGVKGVYENGRGEFVLDEILQNDQRIRLQDFNAEIFVRHFLATNSQKLDSLTAKHIKGAFGKYITIYYNHLPKSAQEQARLSGTTLLGRTRFIDALQRAKKAMKKNTASSGSTNNSNALQKNGVTGQSTTNPKASQNNTATGQSMGNPKAEPEGPISSRLDKYKYEAPKDSGNGTSSTSHSLPADTHPAPNSIADTHSTPEAPPESDLEDGEMSSDALDVALSDMEIELLQRYFPTATGSVASPRCLACASSSHKTFDCPALTCKICDQNHLTLACPLNIRCLKCRARGHHTSQCPEKLSRAPSEAGGCDLCHSKDHLENTCHLIWRSYNPRPEEIRTVRAIPISCYVCGASNHYGPECGLTSGKILSGGTTWSKKNLQKYLDPSSNDRAIAAGTDFSLPQPTKKSFNIKGQANDPIMLDDSDDDVEFIRPSVKPSSSKNKLPGTNQHIRFAPKQNPVPEPSGRSYRAPPPPRQPRQQFGNNGSFQESSRYGRERSFSPPPRYDDFRAGFNENDRYLPQGPARGGYRSSDGGRRTGPSDNSFRGGPSGRGRGSGPPRGGSSARGNGKKRGKKSK